jgi:hypothetical protein
MSRASARVRMDQTEQHQSRQEAAFHSEMSENQGHNRRVVAPIMPARTRVGCSG